MSYQVSHYYLRSNYYNIGKDDKFWGGHFGVITSCATIRVQRESTPTDDDQYADIIDTKNETAAILKARSQARDKILAQILADNHDMLKELMEENSKFMLLSLL